MSVDDRTDLAQVPTVPDVSTQAPVFGAVTEVTKDAFVLELRQYFETKYNKLRVGELPRIDKYSVSGNVANDPLETAVSLVRSYPDLTEDLPLIAITSTSGKNTKLDISNKHTGMIVPLAFVTGSTTGPFALSDGMDVSLTTTPDGSGVQTSRIVFKSWMFANIAAATIYELMEAVKLQALYVAPFTTSIGNFGLRAGGPHGNPYPNTITITGGTALTALGLTVGQTNSNFGPSVNYYERKHTAADLTVNIEIMAESENVRVELTDLVYDFFAYVMEDRKFQFYGRSIFDPTIQNETYQIILKDGDMSFAGESEVPRPADQKDKIYINRLAVPVTAILYSDRRIVDRSNSPIALPASMSVAVATDIPEPS